jgi:hypothetical protein
MFLVDETVIFLDGLAGKATREREKEKDIYIEREREREREREKMNGFPCFHENEKLWKKLSFLDSGPELRG